MERDAAIDRSCINSIKVLAIDAIQSANSGHPGAPMGMAPVGYVLWTRFLKHNPGNPKWPARDRFVLSAGHASMLLYGLLYLTGYDLSIEQIKSFRQLGSLTPGHPEYGDTPGVEMTTGPLGQGISSAVGMELARRVIAARFNRPGFDLADYYVYVMCSDGDLMEGVASEACSLAGHLGLGRLICLYDDNKITIEGSTDLAFSEDVGARFKAYGWDVASVDDANDLEAVSAAIDHARQEEEKPSLIMVSSKIACGSPNFEGCKDSHGSPLGEEEARLTRENIGWTAEEEFVVPQNVLDSMRQAVEKGREKESEWWSLFEDYESEHPELAAEWKRIMEGVLPDGWESALPVFETGKSIATRAASGKVLEAIAPVLSEITGGSADLAPSNVTYLKDFEEISRDGFSGRNIHFGVREHAMGAIMNGMALHGGFVPYGGTFLVFSDYMRPSVRLASLMGIHVVYVFTHDSLGVGEDGPTHQPVEQLAALRAIPGLTVIRPCDANETAEAWKVAVKSRGPVALVLSRQGLPVLDREEFAPASSLSRGAYLLTGEGEKSDLLMIATGSEVSLALKAREELKQLGISSSVVSMPSWELFEAQNDDYKNKVINKDVLKVAIEAGISQGWEKYVGQDGIIIGIDRFGLSAPGPKALEQVGISVENTLNRIKQALNG